MADNTSIEWTDATWNPIRGCSRVSEGCRNCYAEGVAKRFSGPGMPYHGLIARTGQWNGGVMVVEHLLDWPLRKRKPQRIFVNSMSDLFHEAVPDEWIDQIFTVMAIAERHTFQVLTKRPKRMLAYLAQDRRRQWADSAVHLWGGIDPDALHDAIRYGDKVLPNVWLGVSVEDQATADERIPLLLQTPAAVRWISAEPLLGSVDLTRVCKANHATLGTYMDALRGHQWDESAHEGGGPPLDDDPADFDGLDWVVVGGESGRHARPMHPDWARSLRDQCQAAGVPFLFKQWGNWSPSDAKPEPGKYTGGGIFLRPDGTKGCQGDWLDGNAAAMDHPGKKAAGRMLDGRLHDEYPEARQ